jgi:hypothetical protein
MMKNTIGFAFIFLVLIVSACKKEAGIGGKKTISGTVFYLNGATGSMEIANGAIVMICYGTKSSASDYDQTVLSDADGKYHIDGLRKGDYFITAEFTDAHGFTYTTAGYGVTVENKKDNLALDIDLR